jgi:hypothetical protein
MADTDATVKEVEKTLRGPRSAPRSRSKRAGIIFPIGRVGRQMHNATPLRVSGIAPVLVAAIGQCVMDIALEAAVAQAIKMRPSTTRLNSRDCMLGLSLEKNLSALAGRHCVPGAGFTPTYVASAKKSDKKSKRKSKKSARKEDGETEAHGSSEFDESK